MQPALRLAHDLLARLRVHLVEHLHDLDRVRSARHLIVVSLREHPPVLAKRYEVQ